MKDVYLRILLQTRLLVGFLGERAQFGWWPTGFYEPSSRLFLEPVFAKTSRLAQYHGVLEAARRLHDDHLNVGSYHLFRLPEEVEQDLHVLLQSIEGESLAAQLSQSKAAALDELNQLASSMSSHGVGPTAVGSIKKLYSMDTLRAITAVYSSAFAQNARAYPYLAA
jgi:hypothetical protein